MYQKTEDAGMFTAEEWFEIQINDIKCMREANQLSEKRLGTRQSPTQSSKGVSVQLPDDDLGEKLTQHW